LWIHGAAALLSVFAGSAAWFGFLALAVGLVRRLAGERPWLFRLVNLAAGLMLAGFAVTFLLRLFGT
jgi:arginine exporter protein ArgO